MPRPLIGARVHDQRQERDIRARMPEALFTEKLADVVVLPVADFLDRTRSIVDLVPLLSEKPWYATRSLRDELARRGYELPTSW